MRKFTFLFTLIFIFTSAFAFKAEAVTFTPNLQIYSDAAYMINMKTGDVIFKKNENKSLHPASLTKLMTAIILLEKFKDNPDALKTTYVSAPSSVYIEFYGQNVSTADIRPNEKVNYLELLYALLLPSSCEAGNIIAYNIGGHNIESFVAMMNEKAKELGATNTHFANAHGLHDASQVTSARDIAIITQYAMSLPKFTEIASTTTHTMEATSVHPNGTFLRHTNSMLFSGTEYYYKYAKGIKTGTTEEAGRCLVSIASKDGVDYLIVTMNAPMTDKTGKNVYYNCLDHKTLYEWAYNKLAYTQVLDNKKELGDITVLYGKDADSVNYRAKESFTPLWQKDLKPEVAIKENAYVEDSIIAPIKEGDKVGVLELVYNGEVIFKTDLLATTTVERNGFKYRLSVAGQFFSSKMFKLAFFICIAIVVIYTFLFIVVFRKRKRHKFKPKKIKR